MSAADDNLSNQLLIALPALADPNFARTVALICQHDGQGAMGVVVNRASEYTLGQVLSQMGIGSDDQALCARPVLHGGPVHQERGFVLHDGAREWDSSLRVADGLYLTTSRDVLEAMARGDGPAQPGHQFAQAQALLGVADAQRVQHRAGAGGMLVRFWRTWALR